MLTRGVSKSWDLAARSDTETIAALGTGIETTLVSRLARVAYRQTSLNDFAASMAGRGASEQTIRDMTEMLVAQDTGIYDADWAAAEPTQTSFRSWCEQVLGPAAGP